MSRHEGTHGATWNAAPVTTMTSAPLLPRANPVACASLLPSPSRRSPALSPRPSLLLLLSRSRACLTPSSCAAVIGDEVLRRRLELKGVDEAAVMLLLVDELDGGREALCTLVMDGGEGDDGRERGGER